MYLTKNRSITLLIAYGLIVTLVTGQITFSRDWTGGKRAAPQLAVDCGQFRRVCRHFIHELKQAMSTDKNGIPSRRLEDELPTAYDEEK